MAYSRPRKTAARGDKCIVLRETYVSLFVASWRRGTGASLDRHHGLDLRLIALAFFITLTAVPAMAALDPARRFTQYTQDVWGTDAGLPHSSITAIAQMPDGYLWLGTEEGLARFDGIHFTTFDTRNTPGLRSNRISTLLADSKKRLWIGTDNGGLTLFENGRFKKLTTRNGLDSNAIT